jgi:hypothetical protein
MLSSLAQHQTLAQQLAHGGGLGSGNDSHPSLGVSWSRITAELCAGGFQDDELDVDPAEE